MDRNACAHELDRSNSQFAVAEILYWCPVCRRYRKDRDKTGIEVAKDLAPVAGAAAGAALLMIALFGKKNQHDAPAAVGPVTCPCCGKLTTPTKILLTPDNFVAKHNFLSKMEENYTGCHACKKAIAYCSRCRCLTQSQVSRHWVGLDASRSGFQYTQRCVSCDARV